MSLSAKVPPFIVGAFVGVLLPTLGCRHASPDSATEIRPNPQDLVFEQFDARRLCVGCAGFSWRFGTSPDGRYLYRTAETGLYRVDTSVDNTGTDWSQLHHMIREPDWPSRGERATRPVVSPDGSRLVFAILNRGDESDTRLDQEIRIVDAETGAQLQVLRGEWVGPQPLGMRMAVA